MKHDALCDLTAHGGPFEPDCGCRRRADQAEAGALRGQVADLLAEVDRLESKGNHEYAEGMRWTCQQAGHPRQKPDDAMCICGTWSHHVEAGAVVVDCGT